jgi:hypothetical protein
MEDVRDTRASRDQELLERYRRYAADAEGFAERSTGSTRQSFEIIATQWRRLIAELEAKLKR